MVVNIYGWKGRALFALFLRWEWIALFFWQAKL
jgi:hypothetical protein